MNITLQSFKKLIVILSFLTASNLLAQTNVWDGSSSTDWNTAANWSLNLVPTNAHDVVININAAIAVNASPTINSLTVSGSAIVTFTPSGAGARTITIDNTGSSIATGSSLTLNGANAGRTMTIAYTGASQTMSIAGTLNVTTVGSGGIYNATNSLTTVTGTLINTSGTITSTAANLSFSSNGTYQHNRNGGPIPTATWNVNSNCNITGITGTVPSAGLGQSFGNFTWNCTGQTGAIDNIVSLGLTNIGGNFTVTSTNGQTLNFNTAGGLAKTITVGGNFSASSGNVDFASGNATTNMNVAGNVSVTGTATVETSSTNGILNGAFVMNGAGTRTINYATPTNVIYVNVTVNSGTTLQLVSGIVLSKDDTANYKGTITVNSGGIIDLNTQVVSGSASVEDNAVFVLSSGGKVITSNATGLQGSVLTATVDPTFDSGASYEFRGAATGVFTLTTPNTITGVLTFNRAAGVTIDQNFTATTLALVSGVVTTGANAITIASGGTFSGASASNYVSGSVRRVFSAPGTLVYPIGKGGLYRPVTFQYTSLTGTSTTSIEQFATALTGTLPGGVSLNNTRYYDVSQTGGTGLNYKLTLDGTGDTITGTVVMLKKESGIITSNAATTPNYTNTTGFTTMTGTVSFTLGSNCTQTSLPGSGQSVCSGTPVQLSANTPSFGSGAWSVTGPSNSSAQFSSVSNPAAVFTPAGGNGNYTLTWTITNGSCVNADSIVINVGDSTTYNGTSWSNGTPTSTKAVIFTGNYVIGADMAACSITVTNNAVVSITSGFDVTLNGAITVSSGSFTVNNNANLIQLTNVANTGNVIVKRLSKALMRLDYTMWSSPVANQNLQTFSPNTLANRFYNYNTTTNLYNAVASPSTTSFAEGKGYLIRTPNNFPLVPTVWPGSFTGVPNNGTINVTLANVGPGQRFNAVGNPYPSTLDLNEFVADNTANITGTIYLWRKTNSEVTAPGYCTWTAGTYVSNGEAQTVPDDASFVDVVSTGQGFLVEATATGTTLEFNNSQRTSNNSNQFFKTSSATATTEIERNRMWLNLTNDSGDFHQMAVGYITDATQGVDAFDGKYFNDGAVSLNSIINGENYVIQGRALPFNDTDVVPLSLTVTTAGNYTISIDHLDGFFSGDQRIFIKDKTNSSLYDLKASDFTFHTEAGTFNNRFEIVYKNPKEANVQASQCGETLTALNQNIYANLVTGAQGYRFRVTNTATEEVQSIDKLLRVFNLAQLPNFAYDKTYTVEVAVKYNNVWQPFGNACEVVTPVAYTKIQVSQCGSQLQTVNDILFADLVSYSTGYRFRITNTSTTESVVVDRALRDIRLSTIGESSPNTSYIFEVAVRNTDGSYLPYGEPCTISAPVNDTGKASDATLSHEFKVVAYPNPFVDQISLNIATGSNEVIQLKVYDMLGKLVDSRELNAIEQSEIQLGTGYTTGVYNVIVTQGTHTEILRIIKR